MEVDKIFISIIINQSFQRLIELADGMGAMTRGIPYRKFRPFNTRKTGFYSNPSNKKK